MIPVRNHIFAAQEDALAALNMELKTLGNSQHKSNYGSLVSSLTKDTVPLDNVQEKVILRLAEQDNCILLGRCADYYLRDRPNCISVFCVDEIENRVELIHDYYKVTLKEANRIIKKAD